MKTPGNTNPAVLNTILEDYKNSNNYDLVIRYSGDIDNNFFNEQLLVIDDIKKVSRVFEKAKKNQIPRIAFHWVGEVGNRVYMGEYAMTTCFNPYYNKIFLLVFIPYDLEGLINMPVSFTLTEEGKFEQ